CPAGPWGSHQCFSQVRPLVLSTLAYAHSLLPQISPMAHPPHPLPAVPTALPGELCCVPSHSSNDSQRTVSISQGTASSVLTLQPARRNDTGLYFCQVHTDESSGQSCGTYLRIRTNPQGRHWAGVNPTSPPPHVCPSPRLLQKRWENERLLQAKKSAYEEENLYEGLNLDECSMYEDISRGLQSTYQDVANIRVLDMQLERP
uniref:CD79a molecule n=1 Tax=Pelusios castaneus TaxID=367368 RepID=A0A8C8S321_9SAUR